MAEQDPIDAMFPGMDPQEKAIFLKAVQGIDPHAGKFTKEHHHDTYPDISPARPEQSAAGKHVVITGAGSGIGKAIAISFAKAGAASITVTARREPNLKAVVELVKAARKDPSTKVLYRVNDLADAAATDATFKSISEEVGSKLQVLIANATMLPVPGQIMKTSAEDFVGGVTSNLLTSFNTIRAFLPYAPADAQVIHINSGAATIPEPLPALGGYFLSKTVQNRLFQLLAVEKPDLFVVNQHPGEIETDMNKTGKYSDTAELPADFTTWLVSPEAKFLRGRFVYAHWDVNELKARASEFAKDPVLARQVHKGTQGA